MTSIPKNEPAFYSQQTHDGQLAFEITPAPPKAPRVKAPAKAKAARKTVKGDAPNA